MLRALLSTSLVVCVASDESLSLPPNLQHLLDLAEKDPDALAKEIEQSPFRAMVPEFEVPEAAYTSVAAGLPTVLAHGMGDSCFNSGMQSIGTMIGQRMGSYSTCIPTGDTQTSDTNNGFFMNMDKSVDVFAAKIRADQKLQGGFNAIGFSQGNSLIRGYIQKYNDPPVNAFISVHGTVMGVAAMPACFRQGKPLGLICKTFDEVLSLGAYNKLVQGHLFQADYFRDPRKSMSRGYLQNSQLAQWNNENPDNVNKTYAVNFAKTKRFAMVKALKDRMVWPNEGEWWGSEPDGTAGEALSMKDTKYYKNDLFGLKTADEAGKIHFETTPGNHLQFTKEQLFGWVDKYFKEADVALTESDSDELPPSLKKMLDLAENDPTALVKEIQESPFKAVVSEITTATTPGAGAGSALPTVLGHGMGDSCFNPGMKSIGRLISQRTGSYATCIPTGNHWISDTINGFLMNMDKSVDVFAEKIRADPKLQGGFNAIAFSQGNSLIRGYIQKYNDPPVNTFVSVHGTVMGVASLPHCFRQGKALGLICKTIDEVLGAFAYNKLVQGHLFQADYFREPRKSTSRAYLRNSQIAQWNNENPDNINKTYAVNFAKTKHFAMVKALQDSMVWPNEGEWWGSEPDGTAGNPLSMKDTKYYKDDLFGLRTADEAGKISFETTPGDHLQFTKEELEAWVDKYFLGQEQAVVV